MTEPDRPAGDPGSEPQHAAPEPETEQLAEPQHAEPGPSEPGPAETAPAETAPAETEPAVPDAPLVAGKRPKSDRGPHRDIPWRRYLVLGIIVLVLAVVLFIFMTSFLPRWWAQKVGQQTNATFGGGVGWGLFYGFVFTLFPLMVAGLAFVRRWKSVIARVVFIVVGVLLAAPNLITLGIVVGTGSAAHGAERVLDVNAPWFRGSTLIGALVAVVVAALLWVLSIIRHRRVTELKALRAEREALEESDSAQLKANRKASRAEAKAARLRERAHH